MGLKPEIQENSLWKYYLCRTCRILCSCSKANRCGQPAKARAAACAAVCLQYTLHQQLTLASCKQNASVAWIRVIQQMLNSRWPRLWCCLFIWQQENQDLVLAGRLNRQSCIKQALFCGTLESSLLRSMLYISQLTVFHEANTLLLPKRSCTSETPWAR